MNTATKYQKIQGKVLPLVKILGGSHHDGIYHTMTANKENRVIIDIGANDASDIVKQVKKGHIVYAFEPHPINFANMTKNFKKQNLSYIVVDTIDKVPEFYHYSEKYNSTNGVGILFPFAVGDETGEVELLGKPDTGYVSIIDSVWWNNYKIKAQMVKIDDIIREKQVKHIYKGPSL